MKFPSSAIASLMVTMPFGVSAARHGISVIENDIEVGVEYFDDDRMRPYRLVFREGTRNLFDFDASGIVQIIRVGQERYRVLYTPTGGIRRVTLKPSERRTLTGAQYESEGNIDRHGGIKGSQHGLRRLFPCDDCEETWNVVCSEGVSSVCDLVGYGSPFSTDASGAIGRICSTLGGACSGMLSADACGEQCVEDEDDDDGSDDDNEDDDYSGGAGMNACLDPTSDLYKCEYLVGNPTMRLEECGMVDNDLPYLPGCFEKFGKTNLNFLYFAYSVEPTTNVFSTFPEETFAGLTELIDLNIGLLGLTSLPTGLFSGLRKLRSLALYHNNLTTLPSGVFSGLVGVTYIYLYENYLATLPDRVFEGCSSLSILNIDENELVSLPAGTFTGMGGPSFTFKSTHSPTTVVDCMDLTFQSGLSGRLMSGNELTTLPDGLFIDIPRMDSLNVERNAGLQCIPAVQGAGISYFLADPELGDIYNNGLCECTPEEAVMCQAGTTCEPGAKGYVCV